MRKYIAFTVLFIFLLYSIPFVASAETQSGVCGDNITWSINASDGKIIISGYGEMYDYSILSEAPWKSQKDAIRIVEISEGITKIGNRSFYSCVGLQSLILPKTIQVIGDYAFTGCDGIKSLVLPESIVSVGSYAFDRCRGIKTITFNDGLLSIGGYAFNACVGVSKIEIPASVTKIHDGAFYDCVGLTDIILDNCAADIGMYAFKNCAALKSLDFGEKALSIGENAFYNCDSLEKVVVPASVKSIGGYSFRYSKIKEFIVCDGVESIGKQILYKNNNLKSIHIPASVTNIDGSFAFCMALEEITVDENSKCYYAQNGILYNKPITKIVCVPEAFSGYAEIPSGVVRIEDRTFYDSAITGIVMPDSVTTIGENAFTGCRQLEKVRFSDNLASIGYAAFSFCENLKGVVLPDSLTTIAMQAFCDTDLGAAYVPSSVTSMGSNAFAFDDEIYTVYCEAESKPAGWNDNWAGLYSSKCNVVWGKKAPENYDINDDGDISSKDYLLIKRAVLGSYTLQGIENCMSDVNGDGKFNAFDYYLLKRVCLNTLNSAF